MKRIAAFIMLMLTTFFWGLTFTIVKDAVAQVDVFVFLAQRFVLAFILLLIICVVRGSTLRAITVWHGFVMGVFLFSAYAFQTVALLYTTASNTGFLTGLNVVFVPLIGLIWFRQAIPFNLLLAVICAVAGLFLLCTNGTWQFNRGDILAMICAVCVALHLILTSTYARRDESDVYWLTAIQIGTVGLLSTVFSLVKGQAVLQYHPEITWALLICALCATVFAFLVQTSMQRFISPANTALIFCTEPVFSAIYAWYAAGERLGVIGFCGAALIMAGMLVSELFPKRRYSDSVSTSTVLIEQHSGEL